MRSGHLSIFTSITVLVQLFGAIWQACEEGARVLVDVLKAQLALWFKGFEELIPVFNSCIVKGLWCKRLTFALARRGMMTSGWGAPPPLGMYSLHFPA
jgi:hypothetical protein